MRLALTGSPGVGKTSVARGLAAALKLSYVNEQGFAHAQGLGSWDEEANELVVPLEALQMALEKHLAGLERFVVEGHLVCEMALPVDVCLVLRVDPEVLEARLERRGYRAEKVQDNVFCEGIEYCLKHARRAYGRDKVVEVRSGKTVKETVEAIVGLLGERGLK